MAVKLKLAQLELLARSKGFEDYKSMLYELYVVQGLSLNDLGKRCHISHIRAKKHLKRFGITVRGRGGDNSSKILLTDALIQEIIVNGIVGTAEALGVTMPVLRTRLKVLPRELYERLLQEKKHERKD